MLMLHFCQHAHSKSEKNLFDIIVNHVSQFISTAQNYDRKKMTGLTLFKENYISWKYQLNLQQYYNLYRSP